MKLITVLLAFIAFSVVAQIPKKPNPPLAYNDFTSKRLLTPSEATSIEQELIDFEKTTSNAIVVVVLDDLNDMDIADYADRLGEAWGVGDEKKDNGIVLLIKPFGEGKREATIRVGRGLESVIPDLTCYDIIQHEFIPNMKKNKPNQAIRASIGVLKSLAIKEYNFKEYEKKHQIGWFGMLGIVGFIVLIIFLVVRFGGRGTTLGRRGGYWGGGYWGGGWGGGSSGGGSSGGFGGFGGGSFGGGGASGSW
jgi:uncharacterized protein